MKAIIWAAVSTRGQAADGKGSIDEQIHESRQHCKQAGWQIIDELIVPGFSRNYIDIHEFARNAANEGIYAPSKLLQHFQDNDFDVLMVRDGDRFGRTQTLFSHVVETVVKELGNQVYTFSDGLIDLQNYRMFIAMGGYRAAGEVDALLKKQQIGYRANIKQGIPVNANVARSHKVIRDLNSGKVIGVEVNEDKRQEFLDAASLVLEGVAWSSIEREMYKRFGYAQESGKPYVSFTYYRLFYTPSLWGHMALKARGKIFSAWSREEGHPIPDGVTVNYNTHEPMYTGKLALKIKTELDRREKIKGRQRPYKPGIFSGLVMCADCGYIMSYARMGNYRLIRCQSRFLYGSQREKCNNNKNINEKVILADFKPILEQIIQQHGLDGYLNQHEPDITEETLAIVTQQIEGIIQQIETMIAKQAQAGATVHDIYESQILQAGERLTILKKRQLELKQDHIVNTSMNLKQQQIMDDMLNMSAEYFWKQTPKKINQQLHALLGDYRLVYDRDTFKGIAKRFFT